jgi:hypothetical protein
MSKAGFPRLSSFHFVGPLQNSSNLQRSCEVSAASLSIGKEKSLNSPASLDLSAGIHYTLVFLEWQAKI